MSRRPDAIDDDRLLAYALGLGPDPGLEEALARDPALAMRLARVREEVGAVRRGVEAVAPPPAPDYADLGQPRWARLRAALGEDGAPAPAAPRRRRLRGWRLVAPLAAAAALALVAGLAGLQALRGGQPAPTAAEYTRDQGAPEAVPPGASPAVPASGRPVAAAVVAVGPAGEGGQRLTVVRRLRGSLPAAVVVVAGAGEPLPAGRLALLFLGGEGGDGKALAAGVRESAGGRLPGSPAPPGLRIVRPAAFASRPLVLRLLPPGTDADAVVLP